MRTIVRTGAVAAGVAALVAAGLAGPAAAKPAVTAGEPSTAAVTCGNAYWPHPNIDPGSGRTTTDAAVHTGPYGACTVTGYIPQGTRVTYDCYVVNDYGNTWTHVRATGGASIGWVWDEYLDNYGATHRC